MATPSVQLDCTAIQELVVQVVSQLLTELGNERAVHQLQPGSHLERDLGLGSLERVELVTRLGATFRVNLPDQVFSEADTVNDLMAAILRAASAPGESGAADGVLARAATPRVATQAGGAPRASWRGPSLESAETLTEVLYLHGRAQPDFPHITLCESDSSERVITYGELLESATKMARALEFRGLEPGETVAIMLPTCSEFFFAFFGILLAGAIPVPIYPPFRADRIEEYAARQAGILRNAEARFLVTFRAAEPVAKLLKPQVPTLRAVADAAGLLEATVPPAISLRHRARGEDIAFLQYTSGSTGAPKGVMVTHANLLANLRGIAEPLSVQPEDVAVSWLPLYHDMGLIGAWFVPLYYGLKLVVLTPQAFLTRPERWLWAMHKHRGTLTAAPNFAFELCVRKVADRDIEGLDLSSMRAALNGAEPVHPETLERFVERFGRYGFRSEALLPVYGLAEATLAVSASPMNRPPRVDRVQREVFEREGRAVPVGDDVRALTFVTGGVPIPGFEIRIVDSNGRAVPERVEGELWFGGACATRGYYRNPEATAAIAHEGGWLDSGDRAYVADGELFITGRSKDIIIKAGRNLYPQEVEAVASRVAGVRKGCVVAFGATDARAGTERLVVVAEIREVSQAARIETEITQGVTDTLGLPPDVVKLVPAQSIPKTSSGKLRRAETKRLYEEGKLGMRLPPAWLQMTKLAVRGALARVPRATGEFARKALERVYGLYALGLFALWVAPTAFLVWVAPGRHAAARLTRQASRAYLGLIGCRVRVEGKELLEKLKRGSTDALPCVFTSNHTSYLDVLILLAALPVDYRFSAKIEVRSWPFIGTMARKLGELAFDRGNPQARVEQAEQIEQVLRQGESVLIFPEGTFTPATGVRPFQLGAFKAAAVTRRAVWPLALRGTRQILRDGTLLPRPGSVTLTFCPPLEPAGCDWREILRLRDAARAAIARPAGEPLL